MKNLDVDIDVTEAAGLGEAMRARVTVAFPSPEALADPRVVCFAFPGGGYGRGYFTFDMPGSTGDGQAGWHARRGWIVVSCDHLGVGDSSLPDPSLLTFDPVAAANHQVVVTILERLAAGSLAEGFPPVAEPVVLGMGQSMGAAITVVQQARHDSFDAIAVLGYSAIHTYPPTAPGSPDQPFPYVPRDRPPSDPAVVNQAMLDLRNPLWSQREAAGEVHPMAWGFHHDDVDPDIVRTDLVDFPTREGRVPAWGSATVPGLAIWLLSPGAIAAEAASIIKPVFVMSAERDVVPDLWLEAKAYKACTDITLYMCPAMGHMHNFAGTRELLWARIESFMQGVAGLRARTTPWVTRRLH